MKLFTKYNRVNITATILTFLVGSIAFYFVLQYVLIRQLDESLRAEQQEIVAYIDLYGKFPDIQNTKHQKITIEPAFAFMPKPKTKSIPFYNKEEEEQESIRQLSFTTQVGPQLYLVTVNKSETETEDLLKLIILVTVVMIGFILLSNYIINRKVVNRLWRPFYNTIDRIKDYHVTVQQPLQLSKEPIDEIDLLNDSLNKMTQRIHQDYTSLRLFTENASHEMQTPLAVIRTKVEALLQNTDATEKSIGQLLSIEDATQKLSKLHQSLLLLTKLENRQFPLTETVNLKEIIETKLEERQEMVDSKKISVQLHCELVTLPFHKHLAEILISNLLNNAIRYTPENGRIQISLSNEGLSIQNTATGNALDGHKVFERFYKADHSSEGTGLGLAIIKEICTIAGYHITYQFNDNQHHFSIRFTHLYA